MGCDLFWYARYPKFNKIIALANLNIPMLYFAVEMYFLAFFGQIIVRLLIKMLAMRKAFLLSFCLFPFWAVLSAQSVSFRVQVLDSDTRQPLSGATLVLNDELQVSDDSGSAVFALPSGEYMLYCSYIGYAAFQDTLNIGREKEQFLAIEMVLADNFLKTTTITGSRYDRSILESTVSLEVIKPYLLRNTNTISVDEVLQKLPGVDIIDGQANIRGGSGFSYGAGTRVLILLDDIPALQADAGLPNWGDFPVENIAQIEVLKGAASVLYGSSAMNGIINIRTGFPEDKPETRIASFFTLTGPPADRNKQWWSRAPYETSLSLLHKQKFGKLDVVAAGLLRRNESHNKDVYDRYYRGSLNLRYRLTDRLVFGVQAIANPGGGSSFFYWQDAEQGAMIGDSSAYSISSRFRMNVDPYISYFDRSGGRHKLLARHFYVNNNNNENRSNESWLNYGEYQYQKSLKKIGLDVNLGVVGQQTAVVAELYGDTTYSSRNYAVYAQLEQRLLKKWTITAGARLEYNEMRSPEQVLTFTIPGGKTIERRPVFRVGSSYAFNPFSSVRWSWGQGYRYPTVAERFINTALGPVVILPNPLLQSETGWSTELGYKQGLRLGRWTGFADVAVFQQEYDNMMEFVFTFMPGLGFGFQSQNIGSTVIRGIDANISGAGYIGSWHTAILAGYTYIDPRYREFTEVDSISSSARRNILKYRFQHTAKLDLETGKNAWKVGFAFRYYSFMENIDAIFEEVVVPGLKAYRAENNDGFAVADIRASWQFTPRWKLSALVNNLLNVEYAMRPGLLEAPRNYTLRLDVVF
jgi:outer membrane receptor protein involved in Fe transport